jgi:hypothetical protein
VSQGYYATDIATRGTWQSRKKHRAVAIRMLANQVYLIFYFTVVGNGVYLNMAVSLYTKPVFSELPLLMIFHATVPIPGEQSIFRHLT